MLLSNALPPMRKARRPKRYFHGYFEQGQTSRLLPASGWLKRTQEARR